MTIINSVLGPLDTSKMGITLAHEHIMASSCGLPQNYPELLEDDYMNYIVEGLKAAKTGGINTVVDATTVDLGRDVNLLADASRRKPQPPVTRTYISSLYFSQEPRLPPRAVPSDLGY